MIKLKYLIQSYNIILKIEIFLLNNLFIKSNQMSRIKGKNVTTIVDSTKWNELKKDYLLEKNNNIPFDDLAPNSNKKVWWKCDKNHQFEMSMSNRYSKKSNCPYCSGRKVDETNCILVTHPNVAKEYDISKNEICITNIISGSNKKVWWKCKNNHEWEATVNTRARKGNGCPHCRGNTIANGNTLENKFPDIAKEWHQTKNEIKPSEITPKSDKKVWWKCPKGHEYESKISSRTVLETNCPYCVGKKICTDTSFKFNHPELAKEWNYLKNEKNPDEYSKSSGQNVWWICKKEHEWETSISNRVQGDGCPFCSGRYASQENNFALKHPELLTQFHSIKNTKKPEEYTPASHEKVWWVCDKGHEWETQIKNRTCGNRSNCPKCQLSKLELKTWKTLDKLNINYEMQKKFDDFKNHRFDFYLADYNTLIECDGEQHFIQDSKFYKARTNAKSFEQQVNSDLEKNNYAKQNKINLVRIAYNKLDDIENILSKYFEMKKYQKNSMHYYPKEMYIKPKHLDL
jgi:hypothetical protein